ncbi:MAG: MmgE/PrpD family protein, partial [Pseudomonadota bacterium]
HGGDAHLLGPRSPAVSPATAAFINGFQIHCQEFDCVHEPAVVHPMATILAALLAAAEALDDPVPGPDFAASLAIAVDVAAGLGVAATSPLKFFRPATAGIFGAALGVSKLRRFTSDQMRSALGYALSFCSGSMQAHTEGKPALPVQIANAARGAIMACDLAAAGLEGPTQMIDGPFGYLSLFEDESLIDPVIESLGWAWRIAEVSHKPFPTGRAAQGGIVLMQKLRKQGVTADDVSSIELSAPPLICRLVGRPIKEDMTANYARLCFQYSGAIALMRGTVDLDDFGADRLSDSTIRELGQRISVVDNGITNPAAFTPQRAVATLHTGETVSAEIDSLYGSPENAMSHPAHLDKFRSCVAFGFGSDQPERCARLIALTDELETLDDISALAKLASGNEDI